MQVLRPGEKMAEPDTRPYFYDDFKPALEARSIDVPSTRLISRWVLEDFGPTRQVGGYLHLSSEHMAVFPHASDACSTCVILKGDLNRLEQSMKRQKQQGGQGGMRRQSALSELTKALENMMSEMNRHRAEAAAAIAYKNCVAAAPAIYPESF